MSSDSSRPHSDMAQVRPVLVRIYGSVSVFHRLDDCKLEVPGCYCAAAAALVLKAHKEAVDSLSGNGHAKLGTVAAVVAAANATAREGMKEIHMSLKQAVKAVPQPQRNQTHSDDISDVVKVRTAEERTSAAIKTRDEALLEAQRWRVELGKANEQMVVMQGVVVRAEESARRAMTDAEEKIRLARSSELGALASKEEAFQLARQWQAQAEYYRDQAARYLAILQERAAQEQRQPVNPESVSSVEGQEGSTVALSPEKTVSETPSEVTSENTTSDRLAGIPGSFSEVEGPVEMNETLVDKGLDGDDLTYTPLSLETGTAGSDSQTESTTVASVEVEPAVAAAVEKISSAQTPESSAVHVPSESPTTIPSEVIPTELSQNESREFSSGLETAETPQVEQASVSASVTEVAAPAGEKPPSSLTTGESVDTEAVEK
ncbi:hypothetical protein R1sor_008523 [Riccia sorocarpa]|uniref:Uncharacterized protein n=1 Tax=Riccia sorocarpa TaxID=122646 RepID=A0ABD3HX69_9MARC